jgi:integrase
MLSSPTVLSSSPTLLSDRKQLRLMPKVQSFLDSVSRNSKNTRTVYESGIAYLSSFLTQKGFNHTAETILESVNKNEVNLYELFDNFVAFLVSSGLAIPSTKLYIAAVRSYFAYHDIDIIPSKFKRKVRMPKLYREDEQPLDVQDIRKILLACSNRRYLIRTTVNFLQITHMFILETSNEKMLAYFVY